VFGQLKYHARGKLYLNPSPISYEGIDFSCRFIFNRNTIPIQLQPTCRFIFNRNTISFDFNKLVDLYSIAIQILLARADISRVFAFEFVFIAVRCAVCETWKGETLGHN